MAVGKTFPPDALRAAFDAGARCFGENYVAEAIDKISVRRVTQFAETDLVFLKRLAEEYGYSFAVRAG